MRRNHLRPLSAAVLCLAAFAVCTSPALGAPIDDKRAQAAAIEEEINANAVQLSILNEQVMGAQAELDAAEAAIAEAEAGIATAKEETKRLEKLVRDRAAAVYRSSSSGAGTGVFDGDASELSSREQYADAASAHDSELLDQLDAAREDLGIRRKELETVRGQAAQKRDDLAYLQTTFAQKQAEREQILAGVNAEIAALVEEEAARRRAAETPAGFDPGELPPPPGGGAGAAVSFAQAQLGKPYCYAGMGPTCFDCSGLTKAAWAQAGVSLPHNDEAQYYSNPHVPMNQLAPGDLVWRPGHIGMYVGGGTAIHATKPGDVVRYISVSYFQGAARPG